jgi:hypothetical protein
LEQKRYCTILLSLFLGFAACSVAVAVILRLLSLSLGHHPPPITGPQLQLLPLAHAKLPIEVLAFLADTIQLSGQLRLPYQGLRSPLLRLCVFDMSSQLPLHKVSNRLQEPLSSLGDAAKKCSEGVRETRGELVVVIFKGVLLVFCPR